MITDWKHTVGIGVVFVGLFLVVGTGWAQSGVRSVAAVGTGGGTGMGSGGTAALYTNPAHLTMGKAAHPVEVELLRVAGYSGGDLFQFDHYSRLFVDNRQGGLSDAEEKATLDAWFGQKTRSASAYFELTPLAMTYRAPSGRWGMGIGVRGRVVQKTSMNQGALDLLLRGTEPDRTIPINGRTRTYSLIDVTGAFGYRFSGSPLSIGVAPRLILGTSYADGALASEAVVHDGTLTHHFDYTARAAGTLSTGLYDTFDAFSATPMQQLFGSSGGIVGMGGGVDVGMSYAVRPGLRLSASVRDLGWVRWTESAQTVTPVNNTFRYDGLSIDLERVNEAFGGDVGAYVQHKVDSLARAAYEDVERDRSPFRTGLPTTVHVQSTWDPGGIVVNGGVEIGVNEAAGAVPTPLAVHVGSEVMLGPIPVRAGVRMWGEQALTVSGGLGLALSTYRLDVGGSVTPNTSLLGGGARYAVSLSLGRLRP